MSALFQVGIKQGAKQGKPRIKLRKARGINHRNQWKSLEFSSQKVIFVKYSLTSLLAIFSFVNFLESRKA